MSHVCVRKVKLEDATSLVTLFHLLDVETSFMLFEPQERTTTVEQQQDRLKGFESSTTETMFVAEENDTLLGFIVGIGGTVKRNRHSLSIVIGVRQDHWNKGVGRALMQNLEAWAQANNMHRMELAVMAQNSHAISFYEKYGFMYEGTKRDALKVDGQYVNEFLMSKII